MPSVSGGTVRSPGALTIGQVARASGTLNATQPPLLVLMPFSVTTLPPANTSVFFTESPVGQLTHQLPVGTRTTGSPEFIAHLNSGTSGSPGSVRNAVTVVEPAYSVGLPVLPNAFFR